MTTQTYKTRIRTLYALASTFVAENPILLQGEPATESDTGKKKIGNGVTAWNNLPYESHGGFVFTQSTPASTWTINHNLGFKPAVEVFNTGSQEIEAAVTNTTINQTVISLNVAVAGFARLN